MPDDPGIGSVKKKKDRVDEQNDPVTQGHVHIVERNLGELVNNDIGDDTGHEYNKNVDGKNNPSRQVTEVLESWPEDKIFDVFQYGTALICCAQGL
jgi:hypothetical protein